MAAWKSYAFLLNGCFSSSLPPRAAVRNSDTLSSHPKAFHTCLFTSTLFILWNYHGVITKYIKTLKYVNIYYKNVTLHVYNVIRKEKIHISPIITKISNKTSFLKKKSAFLKRRSTSVPQSLSFRPFPIFLPGKCTTVSPFKAGRFLIPRLALGSPHTGGDALGSPSQKVQPWPERQVLSEWFHSSYR